MGPPHSGVQLHQVRAPVGRPRGPDRLSQVRRPGRAGPRRARHVVLVLAVAVRDARLAARDARPEALLPGPHAGHGTRHPVFLGRPDDHGRLPLSRRAPVRHGVPARHGAGHTAPQDVEVTRQRDRPAGRGPAVRRGRAALDGHRRRVAGVGPDPRPQRPRDDLRPGPELCEQALEHRTLHFGAAAGAGAAARGARRKTSAARRSLDSVARARGDPRRDGVARNVPARRGGQTMLRLRLEGARGLVRRRREASSRGRRHRPRRAVGARVLLRHGVATAASGGAVHHRGVVAEAAGPKRRRAARGGRLAHRAGRAHRPAGRSAVRAGAGRDRGHPHDPRRVSRQPQGAARRHRDAQDRRGPGRLRG